VSSYRTDNNYEYFKTLNPTANQVRELARICGLFRSDKSEEWFDYYLSRNPSSQNIIRTISENKELRTKNTIDKLKIYLEIKNINLEFFKNMTILLQEEIKKEIVSEESEYFNNIFKDEIIVKKLIDQ
jgi:hypothetical protein